MEILQLLNSKSYDTHMVIHYATDNTDASLVQ